MPTREETLALLAVAEERAATEVEVWVPQAVGDRISGSVEELGSITTVFGPSYTTTLRVFGKYVENGEEKDGDGKLVRVAWMGVVLDAQYRRMRPYPDDLVAFHYQKDVTPKVVKGNDYHLVVAVVLDHRTGKSKVPVELEVHVPTEAELANVDPVSGEIGPAVSGPEVEAAADAIRGRQKRSATEPIPGEEPL
jgi:hypothetical protein